MPLGHGASRLPTMDPPRIDRRPVPESAPRGESPWLVMGSKADKDWERSQKAAGISWSRA